MKNNVVPKYYGEFKSKVLRGEIPVCQTISMEMNRIDRLIDNPGIYYDEEAVERWVRFCENELCLTDGSKLNMLDSFKLWGEQVYGWYYIDTRSVYVPNKNGYGGSYQTKRVRKRLTHLQYLILPRGGAKTYYGMCHHAYELVVDPRTSHQITTAPTMKQAEEVLSPFKTSIVKSPGPVFKMLTEGSMQNTSQMNKRPKLFSSKKGIECSLTNSLLEVRPMRIDKLQGLQVILATVDEWLSTDIRENPIDALIQGATKEQSDNFANNWLIICMSSEGTVRNSVGDDIKLELMSILKGELQSPRTSIWWYKLDDIREVNNPRIWIKCNPNLGTTVSYETYQADVEKAEKIPSARNDILAKRFNLPMEGYTYFFTYKETLLHPKMSFWNMPCSLGMDLSQGDDFCAFDFLFPIDGGRRFGVKTRSYITDRTMMLLSPSMRDKYESFLQEGTLIVMNGNILRMMEVYDDLERHIYTCGYDVTCIGYDPYNAQEFIDRWSRENTPFGIIKVIQGAKTESVPLGEIKKLAEDRALLFDEELMKFSMGNAIVLEDTNGNRKLSKSRRDRKIDNVSALMDAFVAYKANVELFD